MDNLREVILKVLTKMVQVRGESPSHRMQLRVMGFTWNSEEELWERGGSLITKGLDKLRELGLEVDLVNKLVQKPFRLCGIDEFPDRSCEIPAVRAVVRELKPVKSFERNDGSQGFFQHFLLVDKTGVIPCVAWDLTGEEVLTEENYCVVEGAYLKADELGNKELHCGTNTRFHVIDHTLSYLDPEVIERRFLSWIKRDIISLDNLQINEPTKISGMITRFDSVRDYEACPHCLSKLTATRRCRYCGPVEIKKQLVFSTIIDDGSEAIKLTVFGELGKRLLGLTDSEYEELAHISLIERLDSAIVMEKTNDLIGTQLIFSGRARLNEITEVKEFYAEGIYQL